MSVAWIVAYRSSAGGTPRSTNVIHTRLIGVTGPARSRLEPSLRALEVIARVGSCVLMVNGRHLALRDSPTPTGLHVRRRRHNQGHRLAGCRVIVVAVPWLGFGKTHRPHGRLVSPAGIAILRHSQKERQTQPEAPQTGIVSW